jgi:hypothetical protein
MPGAICILQLSMHFYQPQATLWATGWRQGGDSHRLNQGTRADAGPYANSTVVYAHC